MGPELPEIDMNTSVPGLDLKAACPRPRSFHAAASTASVAIALSVALGSLGLGAAHASGAEPIIDRHDFLNEVPSTNRASSDPELQKLFWMCDLGASVGDLDAGQSEWCSVVTAHLKRVQFNGDSEAFSEWRRVNQAMAHKQLSAGASEPSCKQAASQIEARS